MRKLVFSFLVVFSSIVFGQSGFNPPKTKINEPLKVENIGIDTNVVLNDTAIFPYQICYIATANGAGYSIGDVIEFNVMYDLKNPTTAWYFDYFNQNLQAFVYKDNSKNGQPILGAIPPITDLKPCINNDEQTLKPIFDSISENNKLQRDSFYALINELKTIDDSLVLKSILDTLSDQNSILKDYFLNDCVGSNETCYINGTNTSALNASEVCSYTVTVIEEKLQYSENGVSSPFDLPVGYTGSNSFKNGSKFLINQVSFTGTTGNSKAIIKVIK